MQKTRGWWARLQAKWLEDDIQKARFEMEEALEHSRIWQATYELRKARYEELSGVCVMPRENKVS